MRIAILGQDSGELVQMAQFLQKQLSAYVGSTACVTFLDGFELQRRLCQESFDLLVLEWRGPRTADPDILRWLRQSRKDSVPIVMVGMQASGNDVAQALDSGADDYIARPLNPVELRARVQRLIERNLGHGQDDELRFGQWELSRGTHSVIGHDMHGNSQPLRTHALTGCEFEIAMTLFRNIGRVVSHTHLQESTGHGEATMCARALYNHISRLRHKLLSEAAYGLNIQVIYGRGYRMDASV